MQGMEPNNQTSLWLTPTVSERDRRWGLWVEACVRGEVDASLLASLSKTGKYARLCYVVSGSLVAETADVTYNVAPGSLLLLRPGESVAFRASAGDTPRVLLVGFAGPQADWMLHSDSFEAHPLVSHVGVKESVAVHFETIFRLLGTAGDEGQIRASGSVLSLLGDWFCGSQGQPSERLIEEKVNQAKLLMRENLSSPLTAEQLASRLGLGYSWFRKVFRRSVGMPPAQYQIQLRLQAARRLLEDSEKTISDIAYELAFDTPGQFSTFFRLKTGMTPKEYRQLSRRK